MHPNLSGMNIDRTIAEIEWLSKARLTAPDPFGQMFPSSILCACIFG